MGRSCVRRDCQGDVVVLWLAFTFSPQDGLDRRTSFMGGAAVTRVFFASLALGVIGCAPAAIADPSPDAPEGYRPYAIAAAA